MNVGNCFGAIVALYGTYDLPKGFPFTEGEVLASTVFDPGYPSSDFRTPLPVSLTAGHYALIFGTGALGSTNGSAGMPTAGQTILGDARFIAWNGTNWFGTVPFEGRFVVEGISESFTPQYPSVEDFETGGGCGMAMGRRGRFGLDHHLR